jgi:hypothetical protein
MANGTGKRKAINMKGERRAALSKGPTMMIVVLTSSSIAGLIKSVLSVQQCLVSRLTLGFRLNKLHLIHPEKKER